MLPLIGLAATLVPDLVRLIAGDKAGTLAAQVGRTVTDVTGAADPTAALKAIEADAATASELRARLASIALDAQRAQNQEADRRRQDELSAFQARVTDAQDARASMVALAQAHSRIAWGAPTVSLIVTGGFFVILALLVFYRQLVGDDPGAMAAQIINISVGTLATGFATVVNFWLGSSQGSRAKDTASAQMQASHAAQLSGMIDTVRAVAVRPGEAVQPAPPAAASMPSAGLALAAPLPAAQSDAFDACVAVTLAYEGGFCDNPADPGGATNFGITRRALEAFLGHAVGTEDVRCMSSGTAIEIYRANYWNLLRCADLPAGVDLMVFDFGVNSGPATAARALQELVGAVPDGAIGRHTLAAVAQAAPAALVDGLADARLAYLRRLAGFAEFGEGWSRRVNDVRQRARRMAGADGTA